MNLYSSLFFPKSFSSLPGESPVPPPSTVSSSTLSTSAVAPPPQPKPGSSSQQDRKVPPPIGTERLARIRQTGSVNPPLLTTSYTASVGQGGIWSFGVGSASGESKLCFGICFLLVKLIEQIKWHKQSFYKCVLNMPSNIYVNLLLCPVLIRL